MTMYTEKVTGSSGLRLFVRSWQPAGQPRGIVVIVPGFKSHSGHYEWVGDHLAGIGLSTYAVDLRGRGNSDGERFFLGDFDDYVEDVHTVVELAKRGAPELPLFLLGHSAGGVVACIYCLDHPDAVDGLICESFAFEVPAPNFVLRLVTGLSRIAPHANVLRLPVEKFSRDPYVVERMKADPLIADEVEPSATVAELAKADERLAAEFASIDLPVLILHGTADGVTRPSGSETFFRSTGSADKTLKLYEGFFHDLLNDVDKELVLSDVEHWINARMPSSRMQTF